MTNDADTTHYYVRAIDPTDGEQISLVCANLAIANAKAAELRMSRYQDVIFSIATPPEEMSAA